MTIKFRAKTEEGWVVDSPLEAFTFPGGEAHIKGADSTQKFQHQIADLRGADSHDLFLLAMWADACKRRKERTILLLPYLPGARADRGAPLGAYVYAEFINSLHIDQIITLDPHSEYMPRKMAGDFADFSVFPVERIIARELGNRGDYYDHPYSGVIAPDHGAYDRAFKAAQKLNVPLYKAGKERDFESGKLTGFTCEALPKTGKLLIVDDICDGGGTFIGLAKAAGLPLERIDLWVTHGIFSRGLFELLKYFDHIYTTDSYPSNIASHGGILTKIPVLPYLTGDING